MFGRARKHVGVCGGGLFWVVVKSVRDFAGQSVECGEKVTSVCGPPDPGTVRRGEPRGTTHSMETDLSDRDLTSNLGGLFGSCTGL